MALTDESVYLGQLVLVLVLLASPTVVMEDVAIDLPDERDQLGTRSYQRFAELRTHVYSLIQQAKDHHKGKAQAEAPAEKKDADGTVAAH